MSVYLLFPQFSVFLELSWHNQDWTRFWIEQVTVSIAVRTSKSPVQSQTFFLCSISVNISGVERPAQTPHRLHTTIPLQNLTNSKHKTVKTLHQIITSGNSYIPGILE